MLHHYTLVATIPWPGQVTVRITPNRITSDLQTGVCGKDGTAFVSPYQAEFTASGADNGQLMPFQRTFLLCNHIVHILRKMDRTYQAHNTLTFSERCTYSNGKYKKDFKNISNPDL